MFRKGRKGMTAAILAVLLVAPLGAAEAAGGTAGPPADPWSRLTGWLWEQAGNVTAFWASGEEGPYIDPDGKPGAGAAQIDEGPYVDPFG